MNLLIAKFFYSILVGVLIAAPIGPVSILCIKYSLEQGFKAGFTVGIGAASGDILYAILAGIGIDIISDYLTWAENGVRVTGGGFLILLSFYGLYSSRKTKQERFRSNEVIKAESYKYIFIISFFTTIFSPMTIMLFISMFSAMDINLEGLAEHVVSPIGIFIGSAGWMILLALLLQYLRHRISDKTVYYINIYSNLFIAIFGAIAIINGCYRMITN